MSNIWHDINPRRISPEKFMAVIEIPKGVKNKYEMDKETGLLRMIDDDQVDEKIIAIPFNDPSYAEFKDINQLPQHTFSEISHFFRVYKSLEGKETVVNEVLGPDEAKEVIKNCIAAYKDMYC